MNIRTYVTVKNKDGQALFAPDHELGATVEANDGWDYKCVYFNHPRCQRIWEATRQRPGRTFAFDEEDLQSLARGVVPEWLRFDADAALDEELAK